jgi:hypothetical protein
VTVYELINPSDKILFDAPSDAVACACAAVVGEGAYAAHVHETGVDVGGFALFGADDVRARLGGDIGRFLDEYRAEIVAALRTFRYVRERTSLNRIVDYAHACAGDLEAKT